MKSDKMEDSLVAFLKNQRADSSKAFFFFLTKICIDSTYF